MGPATYTILASFFICLVSFVLSIKLNIPRALLPYNGVFPVNFSMKVSDVKDTDCFEWHSSVPHIVQIFGKSNEDLCQKEVLVSVISHTSNRQEAVVTVFQKGTENFIDCDVIIDAIAEIRLQSATSEIFVGGPPAVLSVFAVNKEGNMFTHLNGIDVDWKIESVSIASSMEKSVDTIKFINCLEASYVYPCDLKENENSVSVLLKGVKVGTGLVIAKLKQPFYSKVSAVEMALQVSLGAMLKPSGQVYIFPGAQITFQVKTKYGYSSDFTIRKLKIGNTTVAEVIGDSTAKALHYGETTVFIADDGGSVFTTYVHVVEPSYMSLEIYPKGNWNLHEATSYEVFVNLYDSYNHKLYPAENLKVKTVFPSRLFYVNTSSSDGTRYSVRTLVPGSGVIKAQFAGGDFKGKVSKTFDLSLTQKVVIYQAVHVSPSLLLLPFYANSSALYSIPFKVTGGTGFYSWMTSNSASEVRYKEKESNNAIVHFYDEGDFVVMVTDKNSSAFQSSAQVSIQPVADIEVYATVVEAEIGNEVIIPVALLGFESKERMVYRAFDDCTKINISVEIIEKHVVSYKPDADFPPFGRGCLSLQLLCKLPGHSRVNIFYDTRKLLLKTTVVVACHKPLKPLHPVRVSVLALGTSQEVSFEGGPRSWPLHPHGYYEKLSADKSDLLNISILKDPIRYNKDLHVFKVLCRSLGETVATFSVGNKPSPTNRNSAQMESSIKIVCAKPDSLHIEYTVTNKKKHEFIPSEKTVVKVPFYGVKTFEVDIWMKDIIGRKFANISSFDVLWEVSDDKLAKLAENRSFITHVDGSAGYQKVSRNFQKFEMTGKTGALKVTAKLVGYHKYVLSEENMSAYDNLDQISQSIDLQLVSIRDVYTEVYSNAIERNDDENCDGDSCKA